MHCLQVSVPARKTRPLKADSGDTQAGNASLLEKLINPLPVEEFLKSCWKQRAAAFVGAGPARVAHMRKAMRGLDLEKLVNDTPSDSIKAWVRPHDGSRMESLSVDGATALTLNRAGSSVYFRAPQDFTDEFLPCLSRALGADFSIYYADGALRGETETFVARKGHHTDWHTDFQENFTVQLSGSRRWRFKRQPGPGSPLRGLSQHYATMDVYEEQMKVARDLNSSIDYIPDATFFEDAEEVVLSAGDVLYHPAGIWHSVHCESELAISVNFSMANHGWADIIGSAFQQAIWREPSLRARVCGIGSQEELRTTLSARLQKAKQIVAAMTIEDICPPALSLPRVTFIPVRPRTDFKPASRYRHSAVGVLIPLVPEMFEENSDDEDGNIQYVFHANFGNSDLESLMRIVISVPAALQRAVEYVQKHSLVDTKELLSRVSTKTRRRRDLVNGLIRAFGFAGYLIEVKKHAARKQPATSGSGAIQKPSRLKRPTTVRKPNQKQARKRK